MCVAVRQRMVADEVPEQHRRLLLELGIRLDSSEAGPGCGERRVGEVDPVESSELLRFDSEDGLGDQ